MAAYRPENPIFESPYLDQLYTELTNDGDSFYLRAPIDSQDILQIGRHFGREKLLFIQRQPGSLAISREDSHDIQVAIHHNPDQTGPEMPLKTLVFAYPVKNLVFLEHPNGWHVSAGEAVVKKGAQGDDDIRTLAYKIGDYGSQHLRSSLPPKQQSIYN